jgi:choline dehydrogenase-like flavoprotein
MASKGDLIQTLSTMDTPATSNDLKRRSFLRAAFSGALVTPGVMNAAEVEKAIAGQFHEEARDLPLVEDADVIVCGAGPAGIAAAITAARAGAKVRVFEWRGCLGGVWTAGLLGYLLDFDKPGFNQELLKRLDERDMRRGTSKGSICYEPEGMKLLLEEIFVEAGVKFQLHTRREAAHNNRHRVQKRSPSVACAGFHRYDGRWRSRSAGGMQFRVWRGGFVSMPADVAQCAARLQGCGGVAALHPWL